MARILIVGKYYFPFQGGIEAYTQTFAEHLAQRHEVTVLVHNHERGDDVAVVNGVRVIRCATYLKIQNQPLSPAMLWRIFAFRPDIIHFQAPNFVGNAAVLLREAFDTRGIQVIVTHHMDVHGRAVLRAMCIPLYRALIRRAAAVIVTSAKNAAISRDLTKEVPIHAIPLGIDLEKYALTPEERADARAWRINVVGNAPTVGFVGRHARYKGLDVLIKAMAYLPGVHALISGDGPLRGPAMDLARKSRLLDRTHFLGHTSHAEKLKLLASSDVFAFPSTETTEAFGLCQVEAMAMGVPVVASELPTGVTDVAINRETALLSPPGDPGALATRIRQILDDRQLARRLSAGGLAHIRQQFTHDRVMGLTEALLCSKLRAA